MADLNSKTDAASLAALRFLFGILMSVDAVRYLRYGWVKEYYVDPSFHFSFYGFSWIEPWPSWGMYAHFVGLGLLALFIAFGFYFRISAALFTVGFAFVFFAEQAHYLNHFYVIILLSGLLAVSPAHHLWSLDARAGRVRERSQIPLWPIALLRAQLVIIYLYAGIAKLNTDWFRGEPMRLWLGSLHDMPVLGTIIASEPSYYAASYLGLAVDLVLPLLLLANRSRPFAMVALALFHLTNALLFSIGIFPWMMISCNLIFLNTDWPRRLPQWVHEWFILPNMDKAVEPSSTPNGPLSPITSAFLFVHLLVQLVLPLRHHLYPGDVAWTEEGHRFSWRMKLRDKRGKVTFFAQQPDETTRKKVEIYKYLSGFQVRKMTCEPQMLRQFAAHLSERLQKSNQERPKIFASSQCRLNAHPAAPLIDSSVDLSREVETLSPAKWILPRPKSHSTRSANTKN